MSYKSKHRRKRNSKVFIRGTGREFPRPPPGTQVVPDALLNPNPPSAAVTTGNVTASETTEYFQTKCRFCGLTNKPNMMFDLHDPYLVSSGKTMQEIIDG